MSTIFINADDFGLSPGVNAGIVDCYQNGIVNSASLLTNTHYFDDAVALIKKHKLPNIGLHFNLTEFLPLLQTHKTIVNVEGFFYRNISDRKKINLNEVAQELEAQYQKVINAGITITHFDSHHHVHMSELLRVAFINIATKYKIPLRFCENRFRNPVKGVVHSWLYRKQPFYTKSFSSLFYGKQATVENIKLLTKNVAASLEIMCHPGYEDSANGEYNTERADEMKVLMHVDLLSLLKKES